MRIAVCSPDLDERHALSRLLEEALLQRGILPEVVLFPMRQELAEAAFSRNEAFDLALVAGARDAPLIGALCRRVPLILVGGKEDGPAAFDLGAGYFLENPVGKRKLEQALIRCLGGEKKEKAI